MFNGEAMFGEMINHILLRHIRPANNTPYTH